MLFTPVIRRTAFIPAMTAFDRLLGDIVRCSPSVGGQACRVSEEDQGYQLSFDVPGVTREQLSIGIEGQTVRLETLPQAARQYQATYELPQEIDASQSEAKLENGVLTLRLAKLAPQSKVTRLSIN